MSFLYPYVLCALLLPLLLAAAVILVSRGSGRGWRRLVSAAHEGELVTRRPAWRTALPAALCLAALTCAIVALARPIHGYHEAGAQATGRNLLLALDISRSMETQDVKPSRLEEARTAAYELIEALPNDKIGLIVFSGTADLVVPLTYDHTALRDALEQVNRGWAGSGGTNFGLVLKKAMQDFKRSAPDGTNALVILSDGEDTVDSDRHIGEAAKENHLMVVTVGIGTAAGGPIPDERGDNGLWQDENGKHVISKLDAASLQEFAKETGGSYFLMGPNADISTFARQTVQKLDAHEEEFSVNKVPNDLFAYFAGAALLLTVLTVLLATDWRAPRHVSLFLFLLLPLLVPQAWAASAEAVSAYREGLQQMQGDPAKAAEAFSRALLDADTRLQAACHYELGNMAANATFGELRTLYGDASAQSEEGLAEQPQQQQVTPEALQQIVDKLKQNKTPYTDALKAEPSLKAAESNIAKIDELIKKLEEEIERLKQQQQQNQDNQQDQQQNQNDQQQNQDDKQQSDKQQSDNQQNQDKQQNQDQQQNGQDKQDKQDDKDKQDGQQDKQDEQQDKQNGEDKQDDRQDKQNGEDKQDDRQDKQNGEDKQDEQQDKQNGEDKQDEQQDKQNGEKKQDEQQQQNPQEQQQQDEQQAPQPEMSDKEKAERRAASILQMHIDEENGSPIPHRNDNPRPPKKDY